MLEKSYDVEYHMTKSESDGGRVGEVEALVYVYGNVDKVGDRVVEGAFTKSLDDWRSSGDPIPMIWNHDWKNPMAHIGEWDPHQSREVSPENGRPGGLLLKGFIDLDEPINPVAHQAYKLMKSRRVTQFSFGYKMRKDGERRAKDGANDLIEIGLVEAGPTLKGVNADTMLVSLKSESEGISVVEGVKEAIKSLLSTLDILEPETAEIEYSETDSGLGVLEVKSPLDDLSELSELSELTKADPPANSVSASEVETAVKSATGILQGLADSGTTDGAKIVSSCQAAIKVIQALSKAANPRPDFPFKKSEEDDGARVELESLADRLVSLVDTLDDRVKAQELEKAQRTLIDISLGG